MAGALPVIFGQLQWALFELPYRAAETLPGSRIAPSPSIAAQFAHQLWFEPAISADQDAQSDVEHELILQLASVLWWRLPADFDREATGGTRDNV
jgi:hypothetical protein